METATAHAQLRRTARRYSLCAADADDAVGRALEILLTRAAGVEPSRIGAWMQVVIRREAIRVRRERERLLGASVAGIDPAQPPTGCSDHLDLLPCDRPGPAERLERRERARAALFALAVLKPDERRAIILQARGYSYAEICELTGWTYTKVNRCLAEGRSRLRQLGAMD
jgi:RNA polymerase sigma factor (sigma-70 family)